MILSWSEELYKVYENNYGRCSSEDGAVLIPVSHSTANAQIEVTIRDDGTILNASRIDKENAVTIIPVTEDSGARSSGICPMPFADKLIYIAGDYSKYGFGKYADNKNYFSEYIEQLKKWKESEFYHPAVGAVFNYLKKSELITDLIKYGVLVTDEKTGLLSDKEKISGISQEDSFVRFIVNYSDNFEKENRTWLDKTLYDSFIDYNKTLMNNIQLCYATGNEQPVTYKHPSKIRNAGDKAKLISSNDENGFTYRGRFDNKEQALSVGYDYSQKIHKALSWLISRQGISFGGSMNIIVWASAMNEISEKIITQSSQNWFFGDDFSFEDDLPDTEPRHKEMLEKMIFGTKEKYEPNSKVMIMGVDAATTGRLSVSMYSELSESVFYENVYRWHLSTSWNRFNTKLKANIFSSFSLYEIIDCAYGTEQGGNISCKPEVLRDNILRLIPCVTEGRSVPFDIISALYKNASKPLAYDKNYNHRKVLETACSMIRKNNLTRGGITEMGYDPNITDRSYLYGCLLAIADKAESSTYDEKDRESRQTNARRYWNMFSSRPYITWEKIKNNLNPYLNKMGYVQRNFYEKNFNEVMDKFDFAEYKDNSQLEPSYLLGYHHFMSYMFGNKNKD